MSQPKKKAPKKRASKYEEKVKFDGTFEELIALSITGAGTKKKADKKEKDKE
jgi:uncharacterized protein YueI